MAALCPGRVLSWVALAVLVALGPARAQEVSVPLLTLDQDRLFVESAFGRASLAREREATRGLEAENARIEAELIAEEQDLTDRRATLPADEFAALAAAFDQKVERIRTEQDAKVRELARAREEDRRAFLLAVGPLLAEMMEEKGAVAIIDKQTLILSLSAIDITDEAIAKFDATIGPGAVPPGTP